MSVHDRECPYAGGAAPDGAVCHCVVFGGRRQASQPTPSAMLGEARGLMERAAAILRDVGEPGLAQAASDVGREVTDALEAEKARAAERRAAQSTTAARLADLHCELDAADVRQRYAEKHSPPTIFGAPVVEDPSVPAGHVDVERRDGSRVRFDLRTATERMEAEAGRELGWVCGVDGEWLGVVGRPCAKHPTVTPRDGSRVRFDLRTATERMEAEAGRCDQCENPSHKGLHTCTLAPSPRVG